MNTKRFWLTSLVVFIFVFIYEWLLHGVLLQHMYQLTDTVWRSMAAREAHIWYMLIGQIVFALLFSFIFAKCRDRNSEASGLSFGFWVGLLLSLPSSLMWFVVLPIPGLLAFYWFLGGLVQALLMGLIAGAIYKS